MRIDHGAHNRRHRRGRSGLDSRSQLQQSSDRIRRGGPRDLQHRAVFMDARARRHRLETFEHQCRAQGVPLTAQRRAILQTLLVLDGHPTADDVHAIVARATDDISRTTVYRALETFVRMGVITKVCHPGSAVRYDVHTEMHHHLVCLRCDALMDISDSRLDAIRIPDTSDFGFEVTDFRVQLRGICRSCRRLEAKT